MKRVVIGVAVAGLCVAAYGLGRAHAYSVPTTGTLSYTGSLMTFGSPDNGSHSITVALLNGSTTVCTSTASVTTVNGQFTVPLSPSCVTAIHQYPNLQSEVTVDTVALGATSIAAVPYAIEAGAAVTSQMLSNVGLSVSEASSALTINLTQDDGVSTPSPANPVIIAFRSATATTGALTPVQVTTNLFLTIPSAASLGQISGVSEHTYVYAQDYAGSVQLCVSTAGYFDEGSLQTGIAISSAATSRTALYCMAAATGPVRIIGRVTTTQTTAGTWVSAPSEVTVSPLTYASASSTSTSQEHIERVMFYGSGSNSNCTSSPCTILSASPGVSSVTRTGTGAYTINFTSGTFSGIPSCACTINSPGLGPTVVSGGAGGLFTSLFSATEFSFQSFYQGTLLDTQGNCLCMGPK